MHERLFNLFLYFIKFDFFKCRGLTVGEVQLCQSVFGNLIHYEDVKIMNHPYLPWQSKHVIMAPAGYIHARNLHYREDYSTEHLTYQGFFIHEMTHILQYQHGISVFLKGAILQTAFFMSFKIYNPYKYLLKSDKSFWDYNIEQQGDIARDIYFNKIPNIILNNIH